MAGEMLHDTSAAYNNSSLIICSSEQSDDYSVDLQHESQISIAWKNLRFEATKWGFQKKVILKRLNGYFEMGSLNGLLGPSGAGKTTLLNCLSGTFKLGLSEDSEVYLNSNQHKSTVSFFIEQHVHESIVGQLTVKQILQYAFAFKNGICHSSEVVDQCIRQTLKDLFLDEHVLDQHFESCSGGEQRRIAICQELMAIEKPSFLFVDEPTTGLDSASAAEVVKCLQKLCKSYQITVIASIHCPNSETLNYFDKLYILAKGGVCIFSGPPNMIQESLDQVQYETSSEQPPIEALISIACNGTHDPTVTKLANQVLAEEHHSISLHQPSLTLQPNGLPVRQKGFSPIDFALQCLRLSRITFIAKRKTLFISFSLLVIYFGLMASLFSPSMTTASACFSKDANSNSTSCTGNVQEDVKIRENICFLTFVILYTGMIIVCSSAILFSTFVKVFKSEHRNYWYSLGAFFWSSLLISFIEVSLYALFNASLGYFLPAQHAIDNNTINWSRFGLYFLFMWLLSLYMQSFGQLIGIILVNHMEFAIIACMIFNASLTLMNGLFVDMSRNKNALILAASNVVANKYISYGILYTFYGFQRCDWENEYSIIIQFFNMDLNEVQYWIRRVVVNVLIIKLFTLAVMYYKFGDFSGNLLFRLFKKCKDEHVLQSDLISIDYDETVSIDELCNNKKEANEKSSNEVQFDEFSRGRIMIAWRNLTLYGSSTIHEIGSSTMPRKPILRNLNGQFRFGTLNAIMGTSGAGKTSLLKVLNGRCKTRLGADTAFYLTQFTKIHTCFITQEVSNHLMPGLTAKQMLIFASRMKNTRTNVDHVRVALKWLNELDLLNTMDTKVENCSGGERKRLAVALELTSIEMGPNLICLDECTSGLDSNSSRIVISTLHKLAQSHPLTIITSIHQPTAEVLFMFDQLYILARGGVCLYSGAPYDVKPYMNQLSDIIATDSKYAIETLIKHSCSNHHNPIVRKLVRHNDSQLLQVKTSELLDDTQLVLDGVQKNRHRFSLRSSYVLFMRYVAYFRGHQWIESIFFAFNFFFYGFALRFFYQKKMIYIDGCLNIEEDDTSACRRTPDNVEDLYQLLNNFKFNFFYANFFLFFIVFQCSMSFLKELKFFKNEHRNGWYSSGSLYLMKSLVDILPLIPVIMFYVYICNWYEEIRPGIYWNFVYIFLLGAVAFQGMGHVFAICSNGNITVLIVLSTTVFFFFTLLSNFLLTYSRLHYIYQFISNLAISKFIFEAVMLLIYGFGRCSNNEIQQLLYTMTINDADYNHCIVMLIFNIVFYRVLTIYLLIWKANPVENRRQRMARIVDYMGNLEPARTLIPGLSASQLDLSVKVPNV